MCCPIWHVSPRAGAYISFVIARMALQLSSNDVVASDEA